MNKENLAPDGVWDSKPFGFTQAVSVEGKRLLFISGQAGMNQSGAIVGNDFESQCRQAFENIATILKQSDVDFHSVVKLTVFLTDISNLMKFTNISGEYFKGDFSTQSAFEVKSLALPGLQVEIEAIAVL